MSQDYGKALKSGEKAYKDALAKKEFPYLPALDAMIRASDIRAEENLGLMDLPLEQVVGTRTAGRQMSFAPNFMPLLKPGSEFSIKWSSVLTYQMEEGISDPVTAYEFLGKYYIGEGNKRVSVLKYLGAYSVEAVVTRIIPNRSEDTQVKVFYEYMDFYRRTRINFIWFSKEGGFAQLVELCGRKQDEVWTEEQVEDFSDAYHRFSDLLKGSGGDKLKITGGDAFLTYLQLHPYEELKEKPAGRMKAEIASIWKELSVLSDDPESALQMDPSGSSESGPLTRYFSGIPSRDLSVAFIHQKPMEISGWVYGHELGRMYLNQAFNGKVRTVAYFMDEEADNAFRVAEAAIADGCNIIFTTSELLLTDSLKAAIDHPNIKILNCSVNRPSSAVRTYFGRMYEAKFLEGMIAAAMSAKDDILYVSDYPVGGSISNINAFARGAAMVNPRAVIHISWINRTDYDPDDLLRQYDIEMVSGIDMIRPGSSGREYGLYIKKDGHIENLAAPVWNWGAFYEKMLRDVISGSWKHDQKTHRAINYWWGMSGGIVDLIVSEKLPQGIRTLTDLMRREIIAHQFHPFGGVVRMQNGKQAGRADGTLSPEEIINMDMLAENVIGTVPDADDLNPEAVKILTIRGKGPKK